MVIHDDKTFKFITQIFLLLALLLYFVIVYSYKRKKVEITYKVALKIALIVFPIMAFPFIVFSKLTLLDKIMATLLAVSGALLQFYGTISYHKIKKILHKSSDDRDKF